MMGRQLSELAPHPVLSVRSAWPASPTVLTADCQLLTVFVERVDQIMRDLFRRATLDLKTLQHEYELSVLHQRDRWRRRRVPREVGAGAIGRFGVLAGEN